MIHQLIHFAIIFFGIFMNVTAMIVIALKTPAILKEYSVLLVNTCIIELFSVVAHFIVGPRLFVSSKILISIAEGPCLAISDRFCAVALRFTNSNMMHSTILIALSFWYRTYILRTNGSLGKLRLQLICIALYIPSAFHTSGYFYTLTPRIELEPLVDQFYWKGYSSAYGLYGYSDITQPSNRYIVAGEIIYPLCLCCYAVRARYKLISILRFKTKNMSAKTRKIHESLAHALTIHAALPFFVTTGMAFLTTGQDYFHIHSPNMEGLTYDIAVLPALINPILTLYFILPYKIFIRKLFTSHEKVKLVGPKAFTSMTSQSRKSAS